MPYLYAIIYAVVCVLVGTALYKLGVPKCYSRKAVHILVGAEWFILYYTAGDTVHFPIICFVITLALLIDYKFHLLKGMSSDGDNAPGTVLYGLSMSILSIVSFFIPKMTLPFGIGVLCTSLGDGGAGVVGGIFNGRGRLIGNKTLPGALANLVLSFTSSLAFSYVFDMHIGALNCLLIALASVAMEMIVRHGLDNLTVPISTSLLTYILLYQPELSGIAFFLLTVPFVVTLIYKKGALTLSATLCAAVLGMLSSIALGEQGYLLLLLYFGFAVLTDIIKKHGKKLGQNVHETRSLKQVLFNGITALLASVALIFGFDKNICAAIFTVGLCESLADTAASGIGALSKRTYDIFRLRKCKTGDSGGMSFIGTLGAILFAAILMLLSLSFGLISKAQLPLVMAAALLGVLLDSFLGSLVQGKYRCGVCGRFTESRECCGTPAIKTEGFSVFTNGAVNLVCNLFSAGLYLIFVI